MPRDWRPGRLGAAAHEIAEHLLEDVGEAGAETRIAAMAAHAAAALEGGVAEAVVGRALLLVLQDVIGFADVLELLLGFLVARVAVRVMLHGELAVGLLEFLGRGAARNPQSS